MTSSRASKSIHAGTLSIVSTPIGNLRDITLRALDVLREAQLVVAEDTRHTRKLLSTYGVHARLMSLHARSSSSRIDEVIERLLSGLDVAYVTDAGSPAVSDPGAQLVDSARRRGVAVIPIPGASSLTAALSCAGLPVSDFRFLGFLPRGHGRRLATLHQASTSGCSLILFESPRRVRALLEELQDIVPDRPIALCRELTKIHEEILRGTAETVLQDIPDQPRGEITIVVGHGESTSNESTPSDDELIRRARSLRLEGLSTGRVAQILSGESGRSRKAIYKLIIDDEKSQNGD